MVFIIHGKKVSRRPLGVVGQFCPICRDIRGFDATGLYEARHIYFVSLSRGKPVVVELQCHTCGIILGEDPHRNSSFALPSSYDGPEGAVDLRQIPARVRDRLAIEAAARQGMLDEPERIRLLTEPIAALNYMIEQKARSGASESITPVITLVFIVLLLASVFVLSGSGASTPAKAAILAATVLFGAITVYRAATWRRSAVARFAVGRLADAYAPLRPTPEEINAAIDSARREGVGMARDLTSHAILAALGTRLPTCTA